MDMHIALNHLFILLTHPLRLMRSLLHMARLQFNTLHSTGLAGSEESDAMTAVESLVKRVHGVAWADQDTVSPRTTSSESPLPRFSLVQFLTFPRSKLPHQQASSNLETRTETFTRLKRDLPVGMNTVPSVQKKCTTPFTKAPFVGHKRQISGLSPNYSPAVKRAKRQVLQDPQSPGHQRFPFYPCDNISHALDGVFPLPEEEIPCGIAPLNSTFTHDTEFASATFHEGGQLDDAQGMKENMNRASVSRESRVQMLSNGPPVNRLEKIRHFSAVSKATAHRVRTSQNEPKSRPAIRRLRYVAAIPSLHNLSTPKRNIVEAQKCRKTY
uniref:Uncharacterized protein n=1 Tax=Eptatretus burgeri TaxID=7764 RepID=A0A8C4QDY0_EPTBU